MKAYRPIRTNKITQEFGQKKVGAYTKMGMLGHNGIDLACWKGEPIYHSFTFPGYAKTEIDERGGIGVDIISMRTFGNGFHRKVRYWHLDRVLVYDGQVVNMGDKIGLGDSTGVSTGHHVHVGYKECERNGRSINKNNGYFGAIDFSYFFNNTFVLDYSKTDLGRIQTALNDIRSRLVEMKFVLK